MKNEKSLFALVELWLSILLPFCLSIAIGVVIYLNSNLRLDLSYVGFNSFIEIFKGKRLMNRRTYQLAVY